MPVNLPPAGAPGVYIQEVDSGPKPIEQVGTATPAFVGFAPRVDAGHANKAVLVTSWAEYVEKFGRVEVDEDKRHRRHLRPYLPWAYLSHAVYGYYANGGGRCYVVALAAGDNGQKASIAIPALAEGKRLLVLNALSAEDAPITIEVKIVSARQTADAGGSASDVGQAKTTGTGQAADAGASAAEGDEPKTTVTRRTAAASSSDSSMFSLSITARGKAEEYSAASLVSLVDQLKASELVSADRGDDIAPANQVPRPGTYFITVQALAEVPKIAASDFGGDVLERSGLQGLEALDEVTMVCVPDLMAAYEAKLLDKAGVKDVQTMIIDHCDKMRNRMAILDPLPEQSPQDVQEWLAEMNYSSEFATLYYPWVQVPPVDGGRDILVPPCGHMAGIWARTDATRGVHKAPANEIVQGVTDLAIHVTGAEQAGLNPNGINCIRSQPGQGIRVWGARTLSGDAAWRYINVRRLFNLIEQSIERGTQWVTFEPNDENLWARVERDIDAFLTGMWREGALVGAKPAQAFFVKCDESLNPPEQRDLGYVLVDIGLAPVKPAEFVVFRFQQVASGGA